jgi:hypothetical protein
MASNRADRRDAVLRELPEGMTRIGAITLALRPVEDRQPFMGDLTDPEVHQALLDALEANEIEGHPHEGDGTCANWMDVRQTVRGLRSLGLWPPAGFETVPGPWDRSVWATDALPLLRQIAEHTGEMHIGGHFGEGEKSPRWRSWHAALLLAEAGLVQVSSREPQAIFVRGLSPAGEDALQPGSADPLDEAEAAVAVGKLREAAVLAGAALDEQVLTPLAVSAGVTLRKNNGKGATKTLGALNVELRDAGAYDSDDYQQILAWLERRNKLIHDTNVLVSADEVTTMIAGVRAFRAKIAGGP